MISTFTLYSIHVLFMCWLYSSYSLFLFYLYYIHILFIFYLYSIYILLIFCLDLICSLPERRIVQDALQNLPAAVSVQRAHHVIVRLQRSQILVPHLQRRHRKTSTDRHGGVSHARHVHRGAEIVERVHLLLQGK